MKKIEYYQNRFFKKMTTFWGFATILATTFWGGFIVGRCFEENISNKQSVKMENEYTLKLVECENDHIREVVDLRISYEREINELKSNIGRDEKKN